METVLLADNNRDFLETRAEFLTQAGYDVITALTLQEAERVLGEGRVQGAILDMRLENDDDPKDESGLTLAKKSDYRLIPKILLTRHPSYEIVREALSATNAGLPPAVDFVTKQEGPEALISALQRLFTLHVRDNPSLAIQFCEGELVSFSNLATLLEPSLSGEQLSGRAAELTNLFRQLFYGKTEIKIERPLWRDEGRVALLVFAFAPGKAQPLVVVCGRGDVIIDEARRRHQFAPDAPAENVTALIRTCETVHFAVNAYALAGMAMEGNVTLSDLYRERPEQALNAALDALVGKTLAAWQQEKLVVDSSQSLADLYRAAFGLGREFTRSDGFRRRVSTIAQQAPRLGVRVEENEETLTFRFGEGSFSYPHPAAFVESAFASEHLLLVNTPGNLSAKNVLADSAGHVWLTDFAAAGPKPALWNYTSLEAIIRFDWVETNSVEAIHDMCRSLTESFASPDIGAAEPQVRKPLKAIRRLRQLALRGGHVDRREYQLGLFYNAAHRLAAFNPANHLTDKELARQLHAVLTQALACTQLSPAPEPEEGGGLYIDHAHKAARVGGRRVRLTAQGYRLLSCLERRRNEPCSVRELIEQVFGEEYDQQDQFKSQQRRLHTAVKRLRDRIEEDPDDPRHLLTLPGVGYMLSLRGGAGATVEKD